MWSFDEEMVLAANFSRKFLKVAEILSIKHRSIYCAEEKR